MGILFVQLGHRGDSAQSGGQPHCSQHGPRRDLGSGGPQGGQVNLVLGLAVAIANMVSPSRMVWQGWMVMDRPL